MPWPTSREIRKKIHDAIITTAPEMTWDIPRKMAGYVEMLSEKLIACCDRKGEVFRCDDCLEATVVLRMTRELIKKYSGRPEE